MSGPVRDIRPPANDLDAEAAVLSTILREPERLRDVRAIVAPREFYADSNRRIFDAIIELDSTNRSVDIVSVAGVLRDNGRLEQLGGTPYLAQLIDATPAVAHVEEHARLVKKAFSARTLAERLARAAAEARSGVGDLGQWATKLTDDIRTHVPAEPACAWPALSASDIFAPLEPVRYLFAPFDICPGAPTLVAGYGFSGKTVALQSMAVSLAAGLPVWGTFTTQRSRVLHVDWEQGPRLTRERYQRLAAGLLVTPDELQGNLSLVSMPQVYLDGAQAEPFLLERCAGFDLVILDSLRAACPSLEENDAAVRNVLDVLTRVSVKTGCTFVVVHHARKPQQNASGGAKMSIRGSGAIFDACGSVLVFEATKGAPTRVMHEKARTSGIPSEDLELSISDIEVDGNPRGGLSVTAGAVAATNDQPGGGSSLDALKERVRSHFREHGDQPSRGAIRERLGVNRDLFFAAMAELEAAGEVLNTGRPRRPNLHLVEAMKP